MFYLAKDVFDSTLMTKWAPRAGGEERVFRNKKQKVVTQNTNLGCGRGRMYFKSLLQLEL